MQLGKPANRQAVATLKIKQNGVANQDIEGSFPKITTLLGMLTGFGIHWVLLADKLCSRLKYGGQVSGRERSVEFYDACVVLILCTHTHTENKVEVSITDRVTSHLPEMF